MNRTAELSDSAGPDQEALAQQWLNALHEPAALLDPGGTLVEANRAFERRIPNAEKGRQLVEVLSDEPGKVTKYLASCTSTSEPLLGALHLTNGDRFTSRGSRVEIGGRALILLRLFEPDERFLRLTRTVTELNSLLRQREHEKAKLEEALRDRDLLHRELQHRVKNNMQMLAGLLHAAKADQEDEAAKAVLDEASRRFAAIAAVHQSIYQLDNLSTIPAGPLVDQIIEACLRASRRPVDVVRSVADLQLPNDLASPLALVVNELLTNALKHARSRSGPLVISVALELLGDEAELIVHDNGTGFHAPSVTKRGSGLGLVRGLVRQLRGKLSVDTSDGTRFTVSFPIRKSRAPET